MCGYCLSATNHICYWVTSSNTRLLLEFDISQSRSTRYPLPIGSMWYFSFFSIPLLYTQVIIYAEQSLIWSQRALIQRWSNRIDKVELGFFFLTALPISNLWLNKILSYLEDVYFGALIYDFLSFFQSNFRTYFFTEIRSWSIFINGVEYFVCCNVLKKQSI